MKYNATLLDPWTNAAEIAHLLKQPNSSLVIGLGAEWCQLCADFKLTFHQIAGREKNIIWLWYNLEEHEELLGDFHPETLPLVWAYQGDKLIRYGAPENPSANLDNDVVSFITNIPIIDTASPSIDIRRHLLNENWAV